jgi:hypothetical protein
VVWYILSTGILESIKIIDNHTILMEGNRELAGGLNNFNQKDQMQLPQRMLIK